MKKFLFAAGCCMLFFACNNTSDVPDRAVRDSVKNPLVTQPVSEDIPKDMHIVNDSVVVPDKVDANIPDTSARY